MDVDTDEMWDEAEVERQLFWLKVDEGIAWAFCVMCLVGFVGWGGRIMGWW